MSRSTAARPHDGLARGRSSTGAGRQVVSVPVTPGEKLTLGRPTVLFEVDDVSDQYDVSSDGTKFLMLRRDAEEAGTAPGQVNLVITWSRN